MEDCVLKIVMKLLKFKRGVLINDGLDLIIHDSVGNPLITEELCKIKKDETNIRPSLVVAMIIDKLALEHKPQTPYDERREGMTDVGDGIFKKTLTEGIGELVKQDNDLHVHYAIFLDGTLRDSSYIADESFKFILGRHPGIYPGFERAVRTMRNQEKAEFVVPRLLCPENGRQPTVDERKTGFLVIEVIRVKDILTKDGRARLLNNPSETLKYAEELRERGKAAFVAGFYYYAVYLYRDAVDNLKYALIKTPEDNKKRLELLVRLYMNVGITVNKVLFIRQSECASSVLEDAVKIFESEEVDIDESLKGKILLHLSRSYRFQYNHGTAYLNLQRAKEYLGDVKEIEEEFKNLCHDYDQYSGHTTILGRPLGSSTAPHYQAFEATFDHMVRTFMSTKAKKTVVFGFKDDAFLMLAKRMLLKNKKVKLEVQQKSEQTCCYILTKK